MRFLITGATGFIGPQLVSHLLASGLNKITLLVREEYGSGRPWPASLAKLRPAYEVVFADLRNLSLTVKAVRQARPECVIHLAAAGVTDPFLPADLALRHNVVGTINLVRACFEKHHSTQKFITARTPGELTSMNTYAASKAAAWSFCQMYSRTNGWNINGAMIFQAYGQGQNDTVVATARAAAAAGRDFPMTLGTQERDWVFVSDVAAGLATLASAAAEPGASVDIGTGRPTSVLRVVEQIYALAGKGGKPLPGRLPGRPGEARSQLADAARTAAMIGWQAQVTLEEGLARLMSDGEGVRT